MCDVNAALQLGRSEFLVLLLLALDTLRDQGHHDSSEEGVVGNGLEDGADTRHLENCLHPRVVVGVVQAAESLAESQVADDVEGGVVVPSSQVESLSTLVAMFVKPLEEEVDVLLDDGLLVTHAALAETVRQGATEGGVLLTAGVDDIGGGTGNGTVELLRLVHLGAAAGAVTHNVLPCAGVVERKLVGADTHNRSVLSMKVEHIVGQSTRA